MSNEKQNILVGPLKPTTTLKKRMTAAEEDSLLDEFPDLPNSRLTPAEKRLISQYGQVFGKHITHNLKGVKPA